VLRGVHVVVLITAPSRDEGEKVARILVEKRLAACVNVVEGVTSIYRWRGSVERSSEVLLVAKTTLEKLPALIDAVRSVHSYEVPEIVALPIIAGFEKYLDWVSEEVSER